MASRFGPNCTNTKPLQDCSLTEKLVFFTGCIISLIKVAYLHANNQKNTVHFYSHFIPRSWCAGYNREVRRVCTVRSAMHRHIKKTGPCPWGDYNLIYYTDCSSALQEKKKKKVHFIGRIRNAASNPDQEGRGPHWFSHALHQQPTIAELTAGYIHMLFAL